MPEMLEIDGSHGEGGGQILRMAVALSAVTSRGVRVFNIRAGRERPGLANQHVTAVRAVAELCNASVKGAEIGSGSIEFQPGEPKGGRFCFDVGTAGSVTLVLQASMLPALLAEEETIIEIRGGTDVSWSPPVDYMTHVLLPLLRRMGIGIEIDLISRGYYPKGGGRVIASIRPWRKRSQLNVSERGRLLELGGTVNLTSLPTHIGERMKAAASALLSDAMLGHKPKIDVEYRDECAGEMQGTGIVLWARYENTVIGADSLGRRGVRAEQIGMEAAENLLKEIQSHATVDVHAADQLLPYIGLSDGRGSYVAREVSPHTQTNAWLISRFIDRQFSFMDSGMGKKVEVS